MIHGWNIAAVIVLGLVLIALIWEPGECDPYQCSIEARQAADECEETR